jgi:hypothetical protein
MFVYNDGNLIDETQLIVRATADGSLIKTFPTAGVVWASCFSRDGHFYARWVRGRLQVWDFATRTLIASTDAPYPFLADISPTGRIVMQTTDYNYRIYDLDVANQKLTNSAVLFIPVSYDG